MNDKDQSLPLFPFGAPNQSMIIAKDQVLIKDSNETVLSTVNAEIRLDLVPRPEINVHVIDIEELDISEILNLASMHSKNNSFSLELKNHNKKINAYIKIHKVSNSKERSLIFSLFSEPLVGVGDDNTQMQYVVFYLYNFKKIIANKGRYSKHVNLEADNWVVELKSFVDSDNTFKKLKSEGGYGLTHVCCLRKKDGAPISGKEARDKLDMLYYFFSFAKGAWCNPVCAVGFDSSNRVWESWSSPKESCSRSLGSWFDEHHLEQLENLFPGFMKKWNDEDWNDTLHKVIYWYVISNTSETDTGIILAQSALERLYYQKLKEASANATSKPKDPERVSLKLNNLFCKLNLPIKLIEESTPRLKKLADDVNEYVNENITDKKKKAKMVWNDAASALTGMRNYLVHPVNEYDSVKFGPAIYDANKLGLWYLELSLLKECGYSETYRNRLTAKSIEEVEKVPWEK